MKNFDTIVKEDEEIYPNVSKEFQNILLNNDLVLFSTLKDIILEDLSKSLFPHENTTEEIDEGLHKMSERLAVRLMSKFKFSAK